MSRTPSTKTDTPVQVEAVAIPTTTTGLRNPPCCGRASAPRLLRTRVIGKTRIADGVCPLCGHRLRIHYERHGNDWQPVLAKDMTRTQTRKAT